MKRTQSPFRTRDEVSALLRVSPRGADIILKKAGVPAYKVGRKILWHEDDLQEFLQARRSAQEGQ
jgi:Helix-turn-helix domain